MRRKIVPSQPLPVTNAKYVDLIIQEKNFTVTISALQVAIRAGDVLFFRDWLKGKDANRARLRETDGNSVIRTAIFEGQIEIVQEFLDAGADVNFIDPVLGQTPIFSAGSVKMAEFLHKCGARLDVITKFGDSLAFNFSEQSLLLKWLYNESRFDLGYCTPDRDPLIHQVVFSGNLPSLHFLLSLKADVNLLDKYKLTPIFSAFTLPKTKRAKVVPLLLEAGANPSYRRESDGLTVLKHAMSYSPELADLLLGYGAK